MSRRREGLRLLAAGELAFPPLARWREPEVRRSDLTDIGQVAQYARWAEEVGFDALFYADFLGFDPAKNAAPRLPFEPLTLAAALAFATSRIGIVTTASTSYHEPYNVARMLASLDHLSRGRVAWNIVTSFTGHENFDSAPLAEPARRYGRAQEFLDVVTALWRSWPEESFVDDKAAGIHVDVDRVRPIDHEGEHFWVRGPLDVPSPAGGRPVLVQAGASAEGIAFAARNADVVFVAAPDLSTAHEFDTALRRELRLIGRPRSEVLVSPGFRAFLGHDEQDARTARSAWIHRDLLDKARLTVARESAGFRFDGLALDRTIPPSHLPGDAELAAQNGRRSRANIYLRWAREPGITLRELLERVALEHGHFALTGTPASVADELERWFEAGVADAFMVGYGSGIEQFADLVLPLLRGRGLWSPSPATDLRGRLGLPAPGTDQCDRDTVLQDRWTL